MVYFDKHAIDRVACTNVVDPWLGIGFLDLYQSGKVLLVNEPCGDSGERGGRGQGRGRPDGRTGSCADHRDVRRARRTQDMGTPWLFFV